MAINSRPSGVGGAAQIITDVLLGVLWLFETVPLTTLSGLTLAFGYFNGVSEIPLSRLIWLPLVMLIDGFVGRRHAQRVEQRMMNDFHQWHAQEMNKLKDEGK